MTAETRRPSIPPLTWFAVALSAGCVAAEQLLWSANGEVSTAGLVAVFSTAGVVCGRRGRVALAILCAGLACGLTLSAAQWWSFGNQLSEVADCGARDWGGMVEADPQPGAYGAIVRVRIHGGPLDGSRVRVGWPEGEPVPELGRTVGFSAVLKPIPIEEPWARRTARGGVCATGNAWSATTGAWTPGPLGPLYAWRSAILADMHGVPGPGGDLLEGIVLGDRRRLLGTRAEQDFQILGLTHLVAVSGSHLALACGAVAFVGSMMRLPKRVLVTATVCAGAAYAIVTGLPYSALRSLLMLVVAAVAQLAGRRSNGIASLSAAVVAVLAIEPWAVFDLGFQLSVLAVGGLLLFGGIATSWTTVGLPERLHTLAAPLGLTLVAQFTTVPVVTSAFGMMSVLAPIANAAGGALVSVALLAGLSGAVLHTLLPSLGDMLLRVAATVLSATAWLASVMASLPGAAVAFSGGAALCVIIVASAASLWVFWPLPARPAHGRVLLALVGLASVALALGPAPVRHMTITVLDVGQGDAILLQDSGRAMLMDAGPDGLSIRRALARAGLRRVDVLVLTHAHDDHTGGVSALGSVLEVGWAGVPSLEGEGADRRATQVCGRSPRSLVQGDAWMVGRTSVRVLWPPAEGGGDLKTNDTSVVLQVSNGHFDAVLTGDAEAAAQQGMAAAGTLRPIEVLKVPHHGSANGLTADALDAWSPEVAVISVGTGNDFGHPSGSTIAMLQEAGVRIERTDRSGDITIEVSDSGYRVIRATRGERTTVRERIQRASRSAILATPDPPATRSPCGRQDRRCTEARLPDLRRRGVAPGARAPPFT